MGSHQKIKYNYLLNQLLSGRLTIDEKNDLWENIYSSYKDQELDLLMQEHWLGLENQEIVTDEIQLLILKNHILSKLVQAKKTFKKEHRLFPFKWTDYLSRIAAILFIPLLLGSILVFYLMDKRTAQISSPIVMQQVMTNPGSRVHFTLPDQTEVWLNSGSKLEFPINLAKLDQRKVKLSGEGYFKVAHDIKHPFIVETQEMNLKVLGTSFDVSSYADDKQISSTLEEGSISLLDIQGNEVVRLYPGQKAILDKTSRKLAVNYVETILTTSWKEGKLIFRNTSLPDVAKQLERWFNCNIHVDPQLLKPELFYTATIQNETLGEVLKMIEISTSVKIKLIKRDIYIDRKN